MKNNCCELCLEAKRAGTSTSEVFLQCKNVACSCHIKLVTPQPDWRERLRNLEKMDDESKLPGWAWLFIDNEISEALERGIRAERETCREIEKIARHSLITEAVEKLKGEYQSYGDNGVLIAIDILKGMEK